jgi:hypothetical protein
MLRVRRICLPSKREGHSIKTIVVAPCLLMFGGTEREVHEWLHSRWPPVRLVGPPRPRVVRIFHTVDLLGYDPAQCVVAFPGELSPDTLVAWAYYCRLAASTGRTISVITNFTEAANDEECE